MSAYPPLDATPIWSRVNDQLIELLGLLPEDKLDWTPKAGLWNAKGVLLHVCAGRGIIASLVPGGQPLPDVLREGQTKAGLASMLRVTWRRMEPFLRDAEALAREYDVPYQEQTLRLSGHWLVFGQLEHDIHHRADIVRYLDELGIAHPEPDVIEGRLKELLA